MAKQDEFKASLYELQGIARTIQRDKKQVTDDQLRAFLRKCTQIEHERFPMGEHRAQEVQRCAAEAADVLAQRLVPGCMVGAARVVMHNIFGSAVPEIQSGDAMLICRYHQNTETTPVPEWAVTTAIAEGTKDDLFALMRYGLQPARVLKQLVDSHKTLATEELIQFLSKRDCVDQIWNILSARKLSEQELLTILGTVLYSKQVCNAVSTRLLAEYPSQNAAYQVLKRKPDGDLRRAAVTAFLDTEPSVPTMTKLLLYDDVDVNEHIASVFVEKLTLDDIDEPDAGGYAANFEEREINDGERTPRRAACLLLKRGLHARQLISMLSLKLSHDDVIGFICLYWPEGEAQIGHLKFAQLPDIMLAKYCGSEIDVAACEAILKSKRADLQSLRERVADQVLRAEEPSRLLLDLVESLGGERAQRVQQLRQLWKQQSDPLRGLDDY